MPARSSNAHSRRNPLRRRPNRRRDWFVLAAVAVVVVMLGVYLLVRPGLPDPAAESPAAPPMPSTTTAGEQAPTRTSAPVNPSPSEDTAGAAPQEGRKATPIGPLGDLARREPADPLARGEVDAPVVMVMFSDYRCPFCAKFSRNIEPELIDRYVESGVMRIEWRDLPIFGDRSRAAAVAGRAAAAQDRFWEFTTAVYADAPDTGHPDLTTQELVDYARRAGVPDLDAFRTAMDDAAAGQAVDRDLAAATELGVPSTPAFVINGYPLLGAQPLAEFIDLIDKVQDLQ